MSESAEDLAANIKSSRHVTIELSNFTNNVCLIDPKVYLDAGTCHSPPEPTVRPLLTEMCIFSKIRGKTTGAVGVLTYDLYERNSSNAAERLVIMFSIPFDYNMYKNWVGVGIYDIDKECNKELFNEMYYNEEQKNFKRAEATGSILTYEGKNWDIMVTMSPMGKSIMKVQVWDKIFTKGIQHPY